MFDLNTIHAMNEKAAQKEYARKLVTIENARAMLLRPDAINRGIDAIAERLTESAEDIAYRKASANFHA